MVKNIGNRKGGGDGRVTFGACVALAALILIGCRTPPPLETFDTSGPGWKELHAQGIWRSETGGTELVIEVAFAKHTDGRTHFQAIKEAFPLTTVQIVGERWVVHEPLRKRRRTGGLEGAGKSRSLWLSVALRLRDPPGNAAVEGRAIVLEDAGTGERLELHFEP